ncbi:hypothetical protein LguiA_007381 [Lonicera macranthoides]
MPGVWTGCNKVEETKHMGREASKLVGDIAAPIDRVSCDGFLSSPDILYIVGAKFPLPPLRLSITVGDALDKMVSWKDARGRCMEQKIEYEWVPMSCKFCGVFGHTEARCNKKQHQVFRQKWVAKDSK